MQPALESAAREREGLRSPRILVVDDESGVVASVFARPVACASAKAGATRILVVEDEEDLREMIAESLSAEGFEILQAANGREALDIARRERPSLIVTDLEMPVMTGWELVRAVRAEPSLSGIPIVIASSSHEIPGGATAHVAKPFGLASLLATIDSAAQLESSDHGSRGDSVPRSHA